MGSVYDVEDVSVGKRYVLKTLHPQFVSRHDLAKRMETEARTLAKLQHPNIVDVVTAGLTAEAKALPFYVMERLNGQNLRLLIEKKGALEMTHCLRIAIDVLDALEHAHENSVLHRDVKPDNIFLHRNANGTTITKLLDFGIIRLLDQKVSYTSGKFIGTLRYASPEQIFGGKLGPPSDLYSLGVVLFEMLAGRGPFDEIADVLAVGAAHQTVVPAPIRVFRPDAPPQLEALVAAALAKKPEDRPRDCFTFAAELRRLLRQEEAAPHSSTAVNVLSSAPAATVSGDATELGMPPPSLLPKRTLAMVPPTATGARGSAPPGPLGDGLTDFAVASTLASVPLGAPQVLPAAGRPAVLPAAGRAPIIDRGAETRAKSGPGFTQRLATNGTLAEPAAAAFDTGEAVRAALAQRAPLEVPPMTGAGPEARGNDIVFSHLHSHVPGTGPLAGEARTRPPEQPSQFVPFVLAALAGASLVSGAIYLGFAKPWTRLSHRATVSHSSAAAAPPPPPVSVLPTSSAGVPRPLPK
jgi:serine/threonine-protein kinase